MQLLRMTDNGRSGSRCAFRLVLRGGDGCGGGGGGGGGSAATIVKCRRGVVLLGVALLIRERGCYSRTSFMFRIWDLRGVVVLGAVTPTLFVTP